MSSGPTPRVEMNLESIAGNARAVLLTCQSHGVALTAVTKVVCAHPQILSTLTAAGIQSLGDSRLENLRRIATACPGVQRVLLRLPSPDRADEVVQLAHISLNSQLATLRELNRAALAAGLRHGVIIMVDVGDLREGIWPCEAPALGAALAGLPGLEVLGVGTNLACYGGVAPDLVNMERLLEVGRQLSQALGQPLRLVSGGNSANWPLLLSGSMPPGINHLRLGEALLLGRETVGRTPIAGLACDAFTLVAQVIEVRTKPSLPVGTVGQDSFGATPEFVDRGRRRRAIVAVGRQDVVPAGLEPLDPGVEILGASSDHMILDVEASPAAITVGQELRFTVNGYAALLALFTSDYVHKLPTTG